LKPIKLALPPKPTTEEKVAAIELILEQFLDKAGKFDVTSFSKAFYDIQKLVQDKIPDWQTSLADCPLFADDDLTEKFINTLKLTNPKPTDFAALGHQISFDQKEDGIKQFSSVEMRHSVPPVGEEIIIFHPGYQCCVQGVVNEITPVSIHVKNLSIGGDFVVPLIDGFIKWLPADRYNDVKVNGAEVTKVAKVIKGFSKPKTESELTKLIKGYIGD